MRNIDALTKEMQELVHLFLKRLDDQNIKYSIIETLRTKGTQEAFYAQGRESLADVNNKREAVGLWKITEDDNDRVVTKTMNSKHLLGKAIDIAPIINNRIPWNVNSKEVADAWRRIGEIGLSVGLDWGGTWKPLDEFGLGWDLPHFEMKT